MKKILTLLTGIVFLIAILVAGGCDSAIDDDNSKGSKKVKIYLKAVEIDGEMHLKMYDSNDRDSVVVDSLETLAKPGITVVWKLKFASGIKKIIRIGPIEDDQNIFEEDAEKRFLIKGFKLEVPDNAEVSKQKEKYIIEFVNRKYKEETPIDPYLKIP